MDRFDVWLQRIVRDAVDDYRRLWAAIRSDSAVLIEPHEIDEITAALDELDATIERSPNSRVAIEAASWNVRATFWISVTPAPRAE